MKKKFTYDIRGAIKPYDDRDYRVTVSITRISDGAFYSITASSSLTGEWIGGVQVKGMCDYRLPWSASALRKRLQKELEEHYDHDMGDMPDYGKPFPAAYEAELDRLFAEDYIKRYLTHS